jgi:hypothetical protein
MATAPNRQKEKPQHGLGGLRLGLLIFETKTHPVTMAVTLDRRMGSFGRRKEKGGPIFCRKI